MDIEQKTMIPLETSKSLFYHSVKYALKLLFKDINNITYLANTLNIQLFKIIMNNFIYYKSVSPKDYQIKKTYGKPSMS